LSANGKARLTVLRESTDGFVIAEKDLQLRGPGEVLGTRQTGLMEFRVAQLPAHAHLLAEVQAVAGAIIEGHTELIEPLIQRWTGSNSEFAKV
jgi:ATP-dependent DNA helicase RecG